MPLTRRSFLSVGASAVLGLAARPKPRRRDWVPSEAWTRTALWP